MGFFDYFRGNSSTNENLMPLEGNNAFSGYRFELPDQSPMVINYNTNKNGFIALGSDGFVHNYPALIQQSIYENVTHSRCIAIVCDLAYSGGWEFEDYENLDVISKKDLKAFERTNNLSSLVKDIIYYYRLHNRVNIKVIKGNNGKLAFKIIDPATVAYNSDKSVFTVSSDFVNGAPRKEFKRYEEGCSPGEYIIEYDGRADKYYPYPVPKWIAGMKSINIGAQIPDFHLANLENSINPGLIISRVIGNETQEDKNRYLKQFKRMKGAKETGHAVYVTAKNEENLPKFTQLESNNNDTLFKELRESSINDVCIAHGINETIIGVQTPGSLGAGRELQLHYNIMKLSIIDEIINHVNFVVNDLMFICNLPSTFILNESENILPEEKGQSFSINKN